MEQIRGFEVSKLPQYIHKFNQKSILYRLGSGIGISAFVFFATTLIGGATSTPVSYDGNLALAMSPGTEYTTLEIFLHNSFVGLLAAVGGMVILPALALLIGNGYSIGRSIGTLVHEYGVTALLFTPHGIFELPAFFCATAAGFRLSVYLCAKLSISNDAVLYHTKGKAAVDYVLLVGIAVVFFAIAAVIETTFTLTVVEALTGA